MLLMSARTPGRATLQAAVASVAASTLKKPVDCRPFPKQQSATTRRLTRRLHLNYYDAKAGIRGIRNQENVSEARVKERPKMTDLPSCASHAPGASPSLVSKP